MTHTTSVLKDGNSGDHRYVVAELDIASLDNADSETFDPTSELNFGDVLHVEVGALEKGESYIVQVLDNYDLQIEQFGGTDPTSGTDVGTVTVRVLGDVAP